LKGRRRQIRQGVRLELSHAVRSKELRNRIASVKATQKITKAIADGGRGESLGAHR